MKLFFAIAVATSLFLPSFLGLTNAPITNPTSIRAFEEPLVPIGTNFSVGDNADLVSALKIYQKRKSYEDVSALTNYLTGHPNSPWKFSLLANLGIVYRKTGHFSKAIDSWERAWALGKNEKDYKVEALANRVASELATLLSSLGRTERLGPLLSETKGRSFYGSANAILLTTRENLWLMKNKPGDSFKCGPYALDSIRSFSDRKKAHDKLIETAQSSTKGFSLTQVRDLSNSLKMNYRMARRETGASIIIPCVVHWKSGHYAALLKKEGDFYLSKDPTFGQSALVTSQALEDESSGYYLVPDGSLPSGWKTVSDNDGNTIWGRGQVPDRVTTATKPNDKKPCSDDNSNGMAVYSMFAMLVSLNIEDTPVGYSPPIGPDMHFKITYNQLEGDQPANFSFFNFGPCWNCSWLSYVTTPTSTGGLTTVNLRGGGQESYSTYTSTGAFPGYVGYYAAELQSQATLWVTTSGSYERRLPDGSKQVFGQSDPAGFEFLTSIVDAQGNTVSLTYDSSYRLTVITDPSGLQTTLTYGLSGDSLKVTKITDPYGRYASFAYTSSTPYQLTNITDVIGITSQFTYGVSPTPSSAITQMVTPYGTTTFSATPDDYTSDNVRFLNVTEPDGSQVHAESHIDGTPTSYNYSSEPVPSGNGFSNSSGDTYLLYRNTFYWDKKAMQVTGNNPDSDYTKAYIYHFLHSQYGQESPVLESEKPALENRIWYNYPNQYNAIVVGSTANPTVVARVVNVGSTTATRTTQYQYNNTANPAAVTQMTDPIGRSTNYSYAANGIDLTQITQADGAAQDIQYGATYNGQHEPLTATDASGRTTSYSYNSQGQILSVTPPLRSGHSAETTNYGYTNNYLTSITGPLTGAVTSMTYDTLGGHTVNRLKTRSDAESYTLTYTYDNLDRVTQTLYPDSTTEGSSYLNPATGHVDLDLHSSTDRLGRVTTRVYDSTRHLISITDPLSRTIHYGWCSCGSLISITDANGNVTYLNRDLESRLTSKVYPGQTQPPANPDYTYDTAGRVSTYTDKRLDVTSYAYNLDNTVSGITYSVASGTAATPNVACGYDPHYNRVTSMGGVSFVYGAVGALGANLPKTVTNTLTGASAIVGYTYDEWGRQIGRTIDSNNSQAVVFDSLGRVASLTNALCPTGTSFTYAYFDPTHPTNRVGSVSYPNGQSTVYNYFGNTGDERLQEIKNLTPLGLVLSQDDYTYNAVGTIATWQQQTDSNTPLLWTEGYDLADQLKSAVQTNTAISSPATIQDSYGYDAAGNRTSANLSGVTRSETANALNQLTASTATGSQNVSFTGTVNGSDTVTVNGSVATLSGTNFSSSVALAPGSTNTVTVAAQDTSGNSRTNKYQTVAADQPNYSPTYDLDGNELSNGAGQAYTWDAKNELMSIVYTVGANAGNHTEFTYDALGRRMAMVEKTGTTVGSGTVTSTKQLVWDGSSPVEERDATGTNVTKRFFAQGEQIGGTAYYYTRNHLGSIREMTNNTGTIQARYDYDPYGRTTMASGTNLSDFQYAGYYTHQPSGLNITKYRAYDPNTARWLSRDPLSNAEMSQGPNLYNYILNNPINDQDPTGLCDCKSGTWTGQGHVKGFSSGLIVITNGIKGSVTCTSDSSLVAQVTTSFVFGFGTPLSNVDEDIELNASGPQVGKLTGKGSFSSVSAGVDVPFTKGGLGAGVEVPIEGGANGNTPTSNVSTQVPKGPPFGGFFFNWVIHA